MSAFEDTELIDSFVAECHDMMDDVEPVFIQLQNGTGAADSESINSIFRLFHSMKGSASFLSFNNIAEITHKAETFLDLFRHQKLELTPYYIDVQLKTVDAIREILDHVGQTRVDAGFETLRDDMIKMLSAAIAHAKGETLPSSTEESSDEKPFLVDAVSKPDSPSEPTDSDFAVEPGGDILTDLLISPEMAARFAQESSEILELAEQSMLGMLESRDPEERKSLLQDAFRSIHSFKGNCGFMQLVDLESLSHRMENVLDVMRNGDAEVNEQNIDILLKVVDTLKEGLADYSEGGKGKIPNCMVMIEFLGELVPEQLRENLGQKADAPAPASDPAPKPVPAPAPKIPAAPPVSPRPPVPETAAAEKPMQKTDMPPSLSAMDNDGEGKNEEAGSESDSTRQGDGPTGMDAKQQVASKMTRRDIRVDIDKLDSLINLIGELVIAEAMVLRHPAMLKIGDETLDRSIHHLKRISSDLQDVAMSVRMVPLSGTFRKMIRLVHDLSRKAGKKANIRLLGEETEVDKNVIEQISDPLVHIIRNSLDHGIEPPAERVAVGKDETGTVTIEARHEGGEVWIIIRDDGRGLDKKKILSKAIEKGLINPGAELDDEEIFGMIFQPGFSTADKISDISGRGVGMDVVKKNLEKLNGKVRVHSQAGKGSEVVLHIPLTLAIIDGMLIRVGDAQYTIPLLSIRESIAHPSEELITMTPDGAENILIRGDIIPVLRLYEIFGKTPEQTEISKAILVIVESDKESFALMVDELLGQQETVIKGLSSYLRHPKGVSGCTVLGNGQVSLIIDVAGLVKTEMRSSSAAAS